MPTTNIEYIFMIVCDAVPFAHVFAPESWTYEISMKDATRSRIPWWWATDRTICYFQLNWTVLFFVFFLPSVSFPFYRNTLCGSFLYVNSIVCQPFVVTLLQFGISWYLFHMLIWRPGRMNEQNKKEWKLWGIHIQTSWILMMSLIVSSDRGIKYSVKYSNRKQRIERKRERMEWKTHFRSVHTAHTYSYTHNHPVSSLGVNMNCLNKYAAFKWCVCGIS